jgi:hypothetical protein
LGEKLYRTQKHYRSGKKPGLSTHDSGLSQVRSSNGNQRVVRIKDPSDRTPTIKHRDESRRGTHECVRHNGQL